MSPPRRKMNAVTPPASAASCRRRLWVKSTSSASPTTAATPGVRRLSSIAHRTSVSFRPRVMTVRTRIETERGEAGCIGNAVFAHLMGLKAPQDHRTGCRRVAGTVIASAAAEPPQERAGKTGSRGKSAGPLPYDLVQTAEGQPRPGQRRVDDRLPECEDGPPVSLLLTRPRLVYGGDTSAKLLDHRGTPMSRHGTPPCRSGVSKTFKMFLFCSYFKRGKGVKERRADHACRAGLQ